MRRRYITAEIVYDTEDTWEVTLEEIKEVMDMMNNIKRTLVILNIEDGVDIDE
jgi:hypothetical protein